MCHTVSMPAIRRSLGVLLASADVAQQEALRLVIEQQEDVYVVGEANNTHDVWALALGNGADLLLLDWELPVRSELSTNGDESETELAVRDLITLLHSNMGDLRIIVLTLRPEIESLAISAGADAVMRKTDSPEKMLSALVKQMRMSWGHFG